MDRPTDLTTREIKIERDVIERKAVDSSYLKEHKIGIIHIRSFLFHETPITEMVREAYEDIKKEAGGDPAGLIIDLRNNPGGGAATKLYRQFNGKAPDKVEKTNIKIPTTLVRVGEGGCWSVGYRSDKEGHGEKQKYIHEFGDFGRFPKKKPKKGHRKEPDLYAALDERGNVIDLRIIGGTFSLDVDPDTGINWLVG